MARSKKSGSRRGRRGLKAKRAKRSDSAYFDAEHEQELLDKPRRYQTPYLAFVKASWAEYRAANPEVTFTKESFKKLAGELAAKWKEMPDEEKVPFEELSALEKAAYQEKMVAYKAQQLEIKKNAIKRPLGSYMLFATEEREKVLQEMGPETKVVEVARELGRRWAALEPTLKEAYKARASQAREEYAETYGGAGSDDEDEQSLSYDEDSYGHSSRSLSSYSYSSGESSEFSEDDDVY